MANFGILNRGKDTYIYWNASLLLRNAALLPLFTISITEKALGSMRISLLPNSQVHRGLVTKLSSLLILTLASPYALSSGPHHLLLPHLAHSFLTGLPPDWPPDSLSKHTSDRLVPVFKTTLHKPAPTHNLSSVISLLLNTAFMQTQCPPNTKLPLFVVVYLETSAFIAWETPKGLSRPTQTPLQSSASPSGRQSLASQVPHSFQLKVIAPLSISYVLQ